MKPRVYKSGNLWVGRYRSYCYVFLTHEAAVEAALERFIKCNPVSSWISAGLDPVPRLEPIGV